MEQIGFENRHPYLFSGPATAGYAMHPWTPPVYSIVRDREKPKRTSLEEKMI
jgi:hypothetical protein